MAKERTGYTYEKNGRWYARLTFTNPQGKRCDIKRIAENKAEAKKLLKSLLHELEDKGSKAVETSRMTFADLADFYEAHYVKPAEFIGGRKIAGLKDWKHVRTYLQVFRGYFGRRLLREITYSDLRTFRAERLKAPTQYRRQRSVTSVNRELTTLRRVLTVAEREGFISRNPFRSGDSLISVSDEIRRERVLTHEEEARLLAACTGRRAHLRPIITTAVDTAMRRGELLKLRWSDVCLESRLITVKAENSKTGRARAVAMTPRVYDELLKLWRVAPLNCDALVFGIADNIKNGFTSVCKVSGVEGFRFHDLRHTAITRMIAAGVTPMEAMKVSGHSQYATFARYINPTEQAIRKAADALALLNAQATAQLESATGAELIN